MPRCIRSSSRCCIAKRTSWSYVPLDARQRITDSPEILVSGKVMAFLRLVEKLVQLSASSLVTEALRGEEMNLVSEHRELITKAD